MQELFKNGSEREFSPCLDQEQALNLAVRVMTMVDCASQSQHIGKIEDGLALVHWSGDLTFLQYLSKAFPQSDHPSVNADDGFLGVEIRAGLKACKLQKRPKLKIRPTNDLKDHLRLNRTARVVEIFHHTTFLKEHLKLDHDQSKNGNSTEMSGNESWEGGFIPRQLALEVIDSIQKIIFPLPDPKCRKILQSLVSTSKFDPDCLCFESMSIRSPGEQNIAYHYFGARLADLYEEVQNPKPYGFFEEWLERKSGARYVMLATLIGVAIAIVLGTLTLIVSIYQAYVEYQAWKHPVSNGS